MDNEKALSGRWCDGLLNVLALANAASPTRDVRDGRDEDLIETYRGTVSLPFEAGEHQ